MHLTNDQGQSRRDTTPQPNGMRQTRVCRKEPELAHLSIFDRLMSRFALEHTLFRSLERPMPIPQRMVLITGCSSGIGRTTARLLATSGFHVLAGVRNEEQLRQLADESLPQLEPVMLDVTCDDNLQSVVDTVTRRADELQTGGLFALVNNAGMGYPSPVELSDPDEVRKVLEVNTFGPIRLIQQCLPQLRAGHGRIINISSLNGTLALPMVGIYSASKFALEAISDTLRVELRPWGIPVSSIRPGQVNTAIFDKARDALAEENWHIPPELQAGYQPLYETAHRYNERGAKSATSPDSVAQVVLRALRARYPKLRYSVGFDAKAMTVIQTVVPRRLLDRFFARAAGVFHRVPSEK